MKFYRFVLGVLTAWRKGKASGLLLLSECLDCSAYRLFGRAKIGLVQARIGLFERESNLTILRGKLSNK